MIKLLAFVASIISGAQVDVVYASHQLLRGVPKHPFVPRRLQDYSEDFCGKATFDGQEYLAHEFTAGTCGVPPGSESGVPSHVVEGAGEAEICNCYSGCKKDLCCTEDDVETATDGEKCFGKDPGCTWEAAYDGTGDPIVCSASDVLNHSFDTGCWVPQCDVDGDCVAVAANEGLSKCGNPASTECSDPDICKSGYCDDNNLPVTESCSSQDSACTYGKCDGAGDCQAVNKADTEPCVGWALGPLTFDLLCRKEECDAGTCVFKADLARDDDPCGDDATVCQDGDHCETGLCVEGDILTGDCGDPPTQCFRQSTCDANGECPLDPIPEGTPCGICGQCESTGGTCLAVCGGGPKYDGLRLVVRYNGPGSVDGYYIDPLELYCHHGNTDQTYTLYADSDSVYTIDENQPICSRGGGHINNVDLKVLSSSAFTPIHTSCSQPVNNECMLFDDDGFGNKYSAYFVAGRVKGSRTWPFNFIPDAFVDCGTAQPLSCPPP